MTPPWSLADKVVDFLSSLWPDADAQQERLAQIRMAVVAANSAWSPQSILALVVGLELMVYLAVASWVGKLQGVFVPLQTLDLGVRIVLIGALLGVPLEDIAEALREILKSLQPKKK